MNQFEHIKPDRWIFIQYQKNSAASGFYMMLEEDWLSLKSGKSERVQSYQPEHILPNGKQPTRFNGMTIWKEIDCYYWLTLPDNKKREFRLSNKDLYNHFEQYYSPKACKSSQDRTAPDNFYIFHGIKEDKFYIVDKDRAGNQHNTNVGNWANTQVTIIVPGNRTSYSNLGEFIDLSGPMGERLYKANKQKFNEWVDFYADKKDRHFKSQTGSDFDIDKPTVPKAIRNMVVETAEYLLGSDKSSKWQKAASENYLKGQKAHEEVEQMFSTLATQGYLITNNSPNNTHTNEQFKLPTKIRSLPGGERLTSSIVQSARCKNPATKGYPVNRATVIAGRKPVRGR